MTLELVNKNYRIPLPAYDLSLATVHHRELIENYLQSHRIRNHTSGTIEKESRFLNGWFETHGFGHRPLFTWEAMRPVEGREIIRDYNAELLKGDLHPKTTRGHLGMLKKYFSFVLEFPYVKLAKGMARIDDLYGLTLAQPISEFDIPHHSFDGEDQGLPLDPGRLNEFYRVIQEVYLTRPNESGKFRARGYTMMVLAGETGMRADELRVLQMSDLFFASNKIQTRNAKGTRGSGKRSRVTLFSPFAQDSVKHYLRKYHRHFGAEGTYIFKTHAGTPVSYQTMHKELKTMVGLAQNQGFPVLSHFSWHWLRRIFATRFIEDYPDKLSVLVKLLGHTSPSTVHRYIRHSEGWMDKKLLEILEEKKE